MFFNICILILSACSFINEQSVFLNHLLICKENVNDIHLANSTVISGCNHISFLFCSISCTFGILNILDASLKIFLVESNSYQSLKILLPASHNSLALI
jgi:hypothetical protein